MSGAAGKSKGSQMTSAAYAAVAVALILIAAKGMVWGVNGSVVILSSLVDSTLDLMASLLNLFAIRQALVPADREHRFGHGKAEALAGLAQSVIIAGSAVYIIVEAVGHLLDPRPLPQGGLAIAVMAGSIVLTGLLVLYQRRVIRRTGSVAVSADSLHYLSDLAANVSVIAALVLASLGVTWADPVFAIGIAIFILMSSRRIFASSLDIVLDRELPDADRERIKAIVRADERVIGLHDLKTRSAGPGRFIQFHIELDPRMRLTEAHAVTEDLQARIQAVFPDAEIIIHMDPFGLDEPRQVFE